MTQDSNNESNNDTSKRRRTEFPLVFLIGKDEFIVQRSVYEMLQSKEPNCLLVLLNNTQVPIIRNEKDQIVIDLELDSTSKSVLEEYICGKSREELKSTTVSLTNAVEYQKVVAVCEYLGLSELVCVVKRARNRQFASKWIFSNGNSIIPTEMSKPFESTRIMYFTPSCTDFFKVNLLLMLTNISYGESFIGCVCLSNSRVLKEGVIGSVPTEFILAPSMTINVVNRPKGVHIYLRWCSYLLYEKFIEISEYSVLKVSIEFQDKKYHVKFKTANSVAGEYCGECKLKPNFSVACVASNKLQMKLN